MLCALLKNNIQIVENVDDWEHAIHIAAEPLLNKKLIEPRYVNKIITNIHELGTYMILTPGVIMPHARPEDGALRTSMSLLRVNNGVLFPNNDEPVYLFFVLAAQDGSAHLDAIVALATLLESEDNIEMIKKAPDTDSIHKLV